MSSGRSAKTADCFHIAFHPKALKLFGSAAGLLAFHIAGAFPFYNSGIVASNKKWIYSCGDSSGLGFRQTGFPFNLLMIVSAEEPSFLCKHKGRSVINKRLLLHLAFEIKKYNEGTDLYSFHHGYPDCL